MHGRRALTEAYAMNKYVQMSAELNVALAEQERSEKERQNTRWQRFLRKTCVYTRADYSLYLFAPTNKTRITCMRITQLKSFDYTILAFIGVNCVTLAMERPSIPPDSLERTLLDVSAYL